MTRPLAGKRIVNTRAAHQATEFDRLIRARGGEPLSYPCITIEPPVATHSLDAALHELASGHFDWLVLTSTNTVYALENRLRALALSLAHKPFKIAAIGPSTAQAIQAQLGLSVDLLPDVYIAEELAQTIAPHPNTRLLLPESAIARPTLANLLMQSGAKVHVLPAYRTGCCADGGVDLPQRVNENTIDAITFTSSSTVECFIKRLPVNTLKALPAVKLIAIGPKTAQTAHQHGLHTTLTAEKYTLPGILDTLEHHFLQVAD